jgi:hypothetical protein
MHQYLSFLVAALLLFGSFAGTFAQSSLFNIPTSDVLAERSGYIEADFDVHAVPLQKGGWQSYGILAIYGIRKRTEVGLNVYVTRSAESTGIVEFQPNVKYRLYENETRGFAIAGGAIAYLSAAGRPLHDSTASVYMVASKQLDGTRAPRFTAGGYQLIGRGTNGGGKQGFLLGVEQPLMKRATFIIDWNTGKNRFGYAAAGLGLTLGKRSYLYSAYYFGNEGRGNNSLGIYYGYNF